MVGGAATPFRRCRCNLPFPSALQFGANFDSVFYEKSQALAYSEDYVCYTTVFLLTLLNWNDKTFGVLAVFVSNCISNAKV